VARAVRPAAAEQLPVELGLARLALPEGDRAVPLS
jgi:hypothetical protein